MIYRYLFLLLTLFSTATYANAATWWHDVTFRSATNDKHSFALMPDSYRLLTINEQLLRDQLNQTVLSKGQASSEVNKQLVLPLPGNQSLTVKVVEDSVMAAGLASKYPQIKTYRVDSRENNGIYGAIDVTEQGFHAMLFMQDGTRLFIDPRRSANSTFYISYYDKDYHPVEKKPFQCNVASHHHELQNKSITSSLTTAQRTGNQLKTYRLAMSATGEYTAFHGGTVAGALSAIVTTVNRVNVIYQRDLAVKLELVNNTDSLIFTNANTDPFTNNDPEVLIDQNVTQVNINIGSANYDIGHIVSTEGGGLAALGAVCGSEKAAGVTGITLPQGDAFDIDFVAHEMGHQFGGTHTFNSTTHSCGGGNRESSTAYEPGSGTTVMAYAGICGVNNTQSNSDAMFHGASIVQISQFIDDPASGGSCGTASTLNNQQPSSNAGSDFTIPANTPFELTGNGSDNDGDVLSYSWEQVDVGTASDIHVDELDNAIFRTFLPVADATRTFPALNSILTNSISRGETLPARARILNFSLTVRDGNGGVAADGMVVTIQDSQAFKITSHSTATTLVGNTTTDVTWDVANTNTAPISCSSVNILLSTDGGSSFTDVTLAGSAGTSPNDGAHTITVPANATDSTTARLKVKCANNIFFDISDVDLTIQALLSAQAPIISNAGSNNIADPGETIGVIIPLRNNSSVVATEVTGTVTSSDVGVNVTVAQSSYSDIQSATQENNTTSYQFSIPSNHNCGADLPITLQTDFVLATSTSKTFNLAIPVGVGKPSTETNSTAQIIPDESETGITSQVTISGAGISGKPNINVDMDISHSFISDLTIELTSPQGTTVRLHNRTGNDSTNIKGNYPSTLTSAESLSAFNGENLNGVWTLKVKDLVRQDAGTLNSWVLNYTSFTCDVGTPVNTTPVSTNSTVTTNEKTVVTGILRASDIDGDVLVYSIVTNATKGNVVINNTSTGAYIYTPTTGQTGSDSFTFKVNDGTEDSGIATVSITINPVVIDSDLSSNPSTGNNNSASSTSSSGSGGGGGFSGIMMMLFMLLGFLKVKRQFQER